MKKQVKKASKKSIQEIKCYLDIPVYKKFKAKTEEQGNNMSQWIRHQIMKYVK